MSKTKAQEIYQRNMRLLGCIICEGPASIHHCGTGAGGRKNEWYVLPLCWYHHQGPQGIHTIGRKDWQAKYGSEGGLQRRANLAIGIKKEEPPYQ